MVDCQESMIFKYGVTIRREQHLNGSERCTVYFAQVVLWFSSHGLQAINFGSLESALIKPHRLKMFKALYKKGHFYWPMFGDQGDWGNPDSAGGSCLMNITLSIKYDR